MKAVPPAERGREGVGRGGRGIDEKEGGRVGGEGGFLVALVPERARRERVELGQLRLVDLEHVALGVLVLAPPDEQRHPVQQAAAGVAAGEVTGDEERVAVGEPQPRDRLAEAQLIVVEVALLGGGVGEEAPPRSGGEVDRDRVGEQPPAQRQHGAAGGVVGRFQQPVGDVALGGARVRRA